MKKQLLLVLLVLGTQAVHADVACIMSVNGMTKDSVPGYKGAPNRAYSDLGYSCVSEAKSDSILTATIVKDDSIVSEAIGSKNISVSYRGGNSRTSVDVVECNCAFIDN